ncbi:BA14K family protein [Bradyrhizobium sp. LMG 9283]|uniref:BA14K family protein n=1 Tax=Bradyrhizobium sp. LMG 9283 TaxID=592064 RepID=UPI00388D7085
MNSLKVLSAAAAVALVLPLATPSFAQNRPALSGRSAANIGGGGGGAHFGGGARMGGGNFGGGAAMRPSGGSFAAGTAVRPSGGSFAAGPAPRPALSPSFSGTRSVATAGNWQGGSNWSGRQWHGGHWRHRGGGFWPGFAAGAAIGGLGSYAYYGGGYGYYDDPYYYDSYYDEPSVAVVPDSGGDSTAYCAQRYKSYDPASGTYLGYDGQRHPCP